MPGPDAVAFFQSRGLEKLIAKLNVLFSLMGKNISKD